jgi:exonuclease SbcD
VALTGNHDHATTCAALAHAIDLATPTGGNGVAAGGRFYLASEPRWLRLRDQGGEVVPFVLLPYPTRHAYLSAGCRVRGRAALNTDLRMAFLARLQALRQEAGCSAEHSGVLAAHVNMLPGAAAFRLEAQADVVIPPEQLPGPWSYVALGHIHKAQQVPSSFPLHYPGSIQRLDFGERNNPVGVLLLELTGGVVKSLKTISLPAREFLEVTLGGPDADFVPLSQADPLSALVRVRLDFTPAPPDLQRVHHRVCEQFPHCFEIRYPLPESPVVIEGFQPPQDLDERGVIVAYLAQQVDDETERIALEELLDEVLAEVNELPEEPALVMNGEDCE